MGAMEVKACSTGLTIYRLQVSGLPESYGLQITKCLLVFDIEIKKMQITSLFKVLYFLVSLCL